MAHEHTPRYCAHCVDGTAHEAEEIAEPVCESCALGPKVRGTEQCKECLIAYCVNVDPAEMDSLRRAFSGEPELAVLEAEYARQSRAFDTPLMNLRVRQAG